MTEWFNDTLVKVITGADFEDKEPWNLRSKRCAFVLFFANWCHHCKDLKPEYINFADVAQFIKVYAVDTDAESTLMDKLSQEKSPVKIKGFPTVWIYCNGKPLQEYNGPRTWQGLLSKAKSVCNETCTCAKPKRRLRKK